jgi:hypothetical protein
VDTITVGGVELGPLVQMTSPTAGIHWLDGSPPAFTPSGTAFGIPWSQGQIDRTTPLKIQSSSTSLPLQSWPLA